MRAEVEPSAGAGERSFNVLANGIQVISAIDIAATAGGPLIALTRSFEVHIDDADLQLQFKPVKGNAIVSAVEVLRQP